MAVDWIVFSPAGMVDAEWVVCGWPLVAADFV